MWSVVLHTLRESIHRRMGLVLAIISALVPLLYVWRVSFPVNEQGKQIAKLGRFTFEQPAELLRSQYQILLEINSGLWVFLCIFAAAPLLATWLEKGWADLTLARGLARWQMLVGRYLGAFSLYVVSIFLLAGWPALYFWARTGISPARYLAALAILSFSFAVMLATVALVSVWTPNPGLAILVAFLQWTFSSFLNAREAIYRVVEAPWARWTLDWLYRIVPKHSELSALATSYFRTGEVQAWWPVWSSGVFAACALGLAMWLLRRKSF